MTTQQTDAPMNPRVTEALARDLGKGLARLDPADIARLGLKVGDLVELAGRRKTVGRLMPTYSAYRGRGRVQIDGVTRENAGVSVDEAVSVRPVESRAAETIVLLPMSQPPTESELRNLVRTVAGLAVVAGDRVRANLVGRRAADFKVVRTTPAGAVSVVPSTRVEIARANAPESLPRERKSFRPFSYEDVGGLARELARLREIVELPLQFPEVFERLGVSPPRGVLLHGPSGGGKTLIARALAHETDAAFFLINGPEVIQKHYGESEARLREVFDAAARQSPGIIFIDGIDAVAPKRDRVAGDVETRIVAQLLALMDGLAQRPNVVVLAATNRPDAIDPALRRPGRFDREIMIPIPDRDARREILEIHRRTMPLADDVDLDHWAAVTHGFVGADLEALCREAGMACLRRTWHEVDPDAAAVPQALLQRLEVVGDDFREALRVVEPSAIRELFVERPSARWDDVGGLDDVKARLLEAVSWPLKHAKLLAKAGVRAPRGVLLSGPPGCGKTLIARALANETGLNFLAIKGPELLSRHVGEPERGLRDIFQKARLAAPCLVFLDEVDLLLASRGAGASNNRVGDRVLGQFLSEMDGVEGLNGVVVLAATNRPDRLDPALLRPGRFDLHLTIPPPDLASRTAIAAVALRDKPHAADVSAEGLAELTEACTAAEICAVYDRAAMSAVRDWLGRGAAAAVSDSGLVVTRDHVLAALAQIREANGAGGSEGAKA